jgi:hypothetical protein
MLPRIVPGEIVGWFAIDQLPEVNFGFGQGEAVARVLHKLGLS